MQPQHLRFSPRRSHATQRINRSVVASVIAFATLFLVAPFTPTVAQELPPPNPIDIPCATNMSAQVLGATPVGDGSQTLVLARVIFAPGGSLGAHTHPGTLTAIVETGSFGFTLIEDGEMMITRAATADTEATQEPLTPGEEASLDPGDSFIEAGMIHSARNLSDQQTTVLLAGLIESGQPLTSCADAATPAA